MTLLTSSIEENTLSGRQFNWTLKDFNATFVEVDLRFVDPLAVSDYDNDLLAIHINKGSPYFVNLDGERFDEDHYTKITVQAQYPEDFD